MAQMSKQRHTYAGTRINAVACFPELRLTALRPSCLRACLWACLLACLLYGAAPAWAQPTGNQSGNQPGKAATTPATTNDVPASNKPQRAPVPTPPPMISGPGDDSLEPVVTIRKEGDREVEEYRVRGQLFAMRVKVKGAAAYWLVDPDGSGRMVPGQGIGPTISVPKWVLKEF